MSKLFVYCDGASRGNPGEAGIGYLIKNEKGEVIKRVGDYIGHTTNNVAEYTALKHALLDCLKLNGKEIMVYTDSELMVKQLKGEYRVKNQGLLVLYNEVMDLIKKFDTFNINHIPRERNKEADKLANQGIDKGLTK
ncbi:MAG TPA: ribonuclease H [Peptococcaceae bacterium]|nr:MAG: Ribonuclease H [Clostridia bacterium 41_269]HBT20259.1 ribonuclease H [Peptococcaceae bacterium]